MARLVRFQFRLITLVVVQLALAAVLMANLEPCGGGVGITVRNVCYDFTPVQPTQDVIVEEYQFERYGKPWQFITVSTFTKGAFLGTTYEMRWFTLTLDVVLWCASVLGLGYACEWYLRS